MDDEIRRMLTMTGNLVITIGETAAEGNRRVLDAVVRAKAGEVFSAVTQINFSTWDQFFSRINANRMGVLRYVNEHDPRSINSIASGLNRSCRRVHEDVKKLIELGLIDRQEDGSLSIGYNPNAATIKSATGAATPALVDDAILTVPD